MLLPLALSGDRLLMAMMVVISLGFLVLAVASAGMILAWIGGAIYFAFKHPLKLLTSFLIWWGVASGIIWLVEGSEVWYGWAAAGAMLLSLVSTAWNNFTSDSR